MADYQAHINQANKNLTVLSGINATVNESWDWQVTCAYYVAVHLMNSHIAKTANLHYKTHEKVKIALYSETSTCKIPDSIYVAYVRLENLSRRARYLCHDKPTTPVDENAAFLTYDVHLKKAIHQLDTILEHFKSVYQLVFKITPMRDINIVNGELKNFIDSTAK